MKKTTSLHSPIAGLSPEQLLIIADQFCEVHRVRVRSFSALVAAAAVPGARIEGIAVHADPTAAETALAQTLVLLEPLSGKNAEFAHACTEIYRRLSS